MLKYIVVFTTEINGLFITLAKDISGYKVISSPVVPYREKSLYDLLDAKNILCSLYNGSTFDINKFHGLNKNDAPRTLLGINTLFLDNLSKISKIPRVFL